MSFMSSFSKLSGRLRSWWFMACLAATLLYVLQVLLKFQFLPGPPWPGPVEAAFLVSGANLLGYLVAASLLADSTYRRCRITLGVASVVSVVLLLAYVCLAARYVVAVDDPGDTQVIGSRLQPHIEELVKSNPATYTPKELILHFHDVESVWTPSSVRWNRALLFSTWLLSGLWLTFTLSAIDALSRRREQSRQSRRKKSDA